MTPVVEGIGLLILAAIFGVLVIVAGVDHELQRRRMDRIGRRGIR